MGKDYELERLRSDLAAEKEHNAKVEQSVGELQMIVDDLEKRMDGFDEDSNEWKTRYEAQVEMNQQLHLQALILTEKIDEGKRMIKDGKHTSRMFGNNESSPHEIKNLERSKQVFEAQLRDLEWRLEQESKAYHKANELRKNCIYELNSTKGSSDSIKVKHYADLYDSPRHRNIPHDQRVLDPRKGPIRKTAGVKNLPRLD